MKYKGVKFHRRSQKWRSSIYKDGVNYDCGSWHDTEREAALSRDRKIIAFNLDVPLQILKKVTNKIEI